MPGQAQQFLFFLPERFFLLHFTFFFATSSTFTHSHNSLNEYQIFNGIHSGVSLYLFILTFLICLVYQLYSCVHTPLSTTNNQTLQWYCNLPRHNFSLPPSARLWNLAAQSYSSSLHLRCVGIFVQLVPCSAGHCLH